MNKQLTLACILASLFLAPAFGADLAPGDELDNKFATRDLLSAEDFSARSAEIDKIVKTNKRFDENVVLVNQINANGNEVFAFVSQSGGRGNFAAITQDARVNPAVAMVFQSGSGARAIVSQR